MTYNVEEASNPTQLYAYLEEMSVLGVNMFDKVEIDGTEVLVTDLDTAQGQYQLSTGEHTIKYTLKDPTFIGLEVDEETGMPSKVGATFFGCPITSVEIPNSVTSIGNNAFASCTNLTSVTIPDSVTNIGGLAFNGCNSLTSITIPNSVTIIGNDAFTNCASLTSITIPNSVTSIGDGAFNSCDGLTSITIPNSVTSIGDGAFNSCDGLTSITVDGNNTVYDSRNNCNAIIETATNTLMLGCKNTVIPNTVTSIGVGAFSYCRSLTSITIPDSVTSIDRYAFRDCNSLTSVTIEATTPPTLSSEAFYNTNNCPIYVPSESVDTYKSASVWRGYASRIQAIQ